MSNVYGVAFSNSDPRNYPSLAPTFLTFAKMSDGSAITPPSITQLLIPGTTTTGIYQFTYSASFAVYFLLDGITTTSASERYVYGILDPIQRVDQQFAEYSSTFSAFNSSLVALGNTSVALGVTNVALGTTNVALGVTNVALNTTLVAIGSTLTGFGTTNVALGTTNVALGTSILAATVTLLAMGTTLGLLDAKIGATTSTFGDSTTDPGTLYGYMKRMQEFLEGNASFTKLTGAWDVRSRGGSLLASKSLANTSSTVTKA